MKGTGVIFVTMGRFSIKDYLVEEDPYIGIYELIIVCYLETGEVNTGTRSLRILNGIKVRTLKYACTDKGHLKFRAGSRISSR